MYGSSFSYATSDPNVSRMIEETVAVIHDVDQRLQALKIGLAQAAPHLAPAILARDPQLASRLLTPFASPFVGAPVNPLLPGILGTQIPNPLVNTFGSPFGAIPFGSAIPSIGSATGLPWSGVNPLASGVGSFRLY